MFKTKNVSWVNLDGLCHGCGACYSICPQNAIIMRNKGENNYPEINNKCVECNICNEVCSGQQFDIDFDNSPLLKAFKKNTGFYLAFSKNSEIREKGASGGFITQYLLNLLEAKKIDGAIVSFSDGSFANTKSIIATTKDELINSISSKYYPISCCEAIKYIEPNKKYAFVGKGCEIYSLDLLINKFKGIQNSIYVKIGIMCAHTPYAKATEDLFKFYGLNYNENSKITYRSNGWPGKTILRDEIKEIVIDYSESWCKNIGICESSSRCNICTESFAQKADFVVGDPWFYNKKLENQKKGKSLVITYTDFAKQEIKEIDNIYIETSSTEIFIKSQINLLNKFNRACLIILFYNLLHNKLFFINVMLYIFYNKISITIVISALKFFLSKIKVLRRKLIKCLILIQP